MGFLTYQGSVQTLLKNIYSTYVSQELWNTSQGINALPANTDAMAYNSVGSVDVPDEKNRYPWLYAFNMVI